MAGINKKIGSTWPVDANVWTSLLGPALPEDVYLDGEVSFERKKNASHFYERRGRRIPSRVVSCDTRDSKGPEIRQTYVEEGYIWNSEKSHAGYLHDFKGKAYWNTEERIIGEAEFDGRVEYVGEQEGLIWKGEFKAMPTVRVKYRAWRLDKKAE